MKKYALSDASIQEIKQGYIEDGLDYICLFCGQKTEKGLIYPHDNIFCDAQKYMTIHISGEHGSTFESLLNLDKKDTGLSENQSRLLKLFYEGKSDSETQNEMGISSSTVRGHRFILKEKQKQAKIFLTLMELLEDKKMLFDKPTVQKSYELNGDTTNEILKKYFSNGKLKSHIIKEQHKSTVLGEIAKKFIGKDFYSEKEVNTTLKNIHEDFALLRRMLIEYKILERKNDGSRYWLREDLKKKENNIMDRKKELKQLYKEMKTEAGVYQIKNTKNGKVLVVCTSNLKTINGRQIELERGGHRNKQLQEEWNQFGPEAFAFEILEVLKEKENEYSNKEIELKKLEEKWLEKLQPYGERGYNLN